MKKNGGGFVYPHIITVQKKLGDFAVQELEEVEGISRRDWLAGQIIKGLCANPSVLDTRFFEDMVDGEDEFTIGIDFAYRNADAMITEGEKE